MIPGQMPWLAGILLDRLAADPAFMAGCPGGVAGAAPPDVTRPYATVQTVTNGGLDDQGRVQLPSVQVAGWCAPNQNDSQDPRRTAWNIAASAARVLFAQSLKNVAYENVWYSVNRLVEGPVDRTDVTRGPGQPVYGALIRVELTVRLDN